MNCLDEYNSEQLTREEMTSPDYQPKGRVDLQGFLYVYAELVIFNIQVWEKNKILQMGARNLFA